MVMSIIDSISMYMWIGTDKILRYRPAKIDTRNEKLTIIAKDLKLW